MEQRPLTSEPGTWPGDRSAAAREDAAYVSFGYLSDASGDRCQLYNILELGSRLRPHLLRSRLPKEWDWVTSTRRFRVQEVPT